MRLWTNLLVSALLVATLTSSSTYKTIAKKEAINKEFLSQLKTNKKYKFHLTSGVILYVRVDSVDSERIYGRMPQAHGAKRGPGKIAFTDSIESLNSNVNKISRKKFNPYLTVAAIGVPVGILALVAQNMTYDIGW